MVTADEIGGIAIFADLAAEDRQRLAKVAADISLVPGEYAAYEGAERALFAVLSGSIEAVKVGGDGKARVLGQRAPGDIFGEVPLVLGAVFPVGFRATEPSRVMRIEPSDYYAVAAVVPEIDVEVRKLARHRMEGRRGLQGIAVDQLAHRAIVIGPQLDGDFASLRRFLDRNKVAFLPLEPSDPAAEDVWGGPLPGAGDLPALRVVNGKTVVRPSHRRVAELLGLSTEPKEAEYDTVVVGAGPAGLAAAVYGASEGLGTMVIEREAPGGQAGTSSRIENYLGFPGGVSGDSLAKRALEQARRLGAEILVTRTITRIDPAARQLHLDGGDVLRARTIILACGVAWRHLPIEGLDRLAGRGVSYGAARGEASAVYGLDVHIVGAGNSAGQAARFFSEHARSVTIVCRGDGLGKSMSRYLTDQLDALRNVQVLARTEVDAVHGEAVLEALGVRNNQTGETSRVESQGLYIMIGADAETQWLPPEIALDPRGYVLTGADVAAAGRWQLDRDPYLLETSVPGIFACGDVRFSPVKRVAAAVGEGSMAIAFVHQYLRWAEARREPQPAGKE
ncbi:MAG: FAD-dependent oxidoreductase [Gaiellales bacterium]